MVIMVMNYDTSYRGQGNGKGSQATPNEHQEDVDDDDIPVCRDAE